MQSNSGFPRSGRGDEAVNRRPPTSPPCCLGGYGSTAWIRLRVFDTPRRCAVPSRQRGDPDKSPLERGGAQRRGCTGRRYPHVEPSAKSRTRLREKVRAILNVRTRNQPPRRWSARSTASPAAGRRPSTTPTAPASSTACSGTCATPCGAGCGANTAALGPCSPTTPTSACSKDTACGRGPSMRLGPSDDGRQSTDQRASGEPCAGSERSEIRQTACTVRRGAACPSRLLSSTQDLGFSGQGARASRVSRVAGMAGVEVPRRRRRRRPAAPLTGPPACASGGRRACRSGTWPSSGSRRVRRSG
jgi:hypothetical protein